MCVYEGSDQTTCNQQELWRASCVPSTILGAADTSSEHNKNPYLLRAHVLEGIGGENKQDT